MRQRVATAAEVRSALKHLAEHGVANRTAAWLIDVGTEEYLEFVSTELIDDLVLDGASTCRFFQGPYGHGKTHLLLLLEQLAFERGMAVARTDLSRELDFAHWRGIAVHILTTLALELETGPVTGLPAILDSFAERGLGDLDALRGETLPHRGFQRAMLALINPATPPPLKAHVRQFLIGERAHGAIRAHGITGHLTSRNAELTIKTVLAGLRLLGLPGVLLSFDENEKTLEATKRGLRRDVRIGANLMRRLIDGAANGTLVGTLVVFAVLPQFIETRAMSYPALGERLVMPARRSMKPGWRTPVLEMRDVATQMDPAVFLTRLVDRFEDAGQLLGLADGLRDQLIRLGNAELLENAEIGYRRQLVKVLATATLNYA